jgi:hypothetical protein
VFEAQEEELEYHKLMYVLSAHGRAVFTAIERIGEATNYEFDGATIEREIMPLLDALPEKDRTIVLKLQRNVGDRYYALAADAAEGGEWDPDEFFRPDKFFRVDEDGEDTTP